MIFGQLSGMADDLLHTKTCQGATFRSAAVEGNMRWTLVGVLAATIVAAGCERDNAAAKTVGTSGRAEASAPATAAASAAVREVTIPAGTLLAVVLDTPVGSDPSRVEERVSAHLARPVLVSGETALAAGSRVDGVVTDARRSGKVKGLAHVAVRFESIASAGNDERYAIRTASVGRTAESTRRKDALEIGAPAAGGALIGALLGGKKGAVIGGAVGGGGGTAVVLSTRGKDVRLAKGTALTLKLAEPVTVRVRG